MGKKEREEAYVKEAYIRQVLSCFISTPRTIPLANQNNSPGQPKWSLRAATCVRYIQLVATKRDWMRVPNVKFWSTAEGGGVEAGRKQSCIWRRSFLANRLPNERLLPGGKHPCFGV